jgi:hypothetical protein
MKRWQTRGEVQDSDEEEIGLDVEIQSLLHPPKRLKILNEDDTNKQDEDQSQTQPCQDALQDNRNNGVDDDEGQRGETTGTTEVVSLSAVNAPADTIVSCSLAVKDDDHESAWNSPINTKTYDRLQGLSRLHTGKSRDLFLVVTQAERNAVDITSPQAIYDPPSSSFLPKDAIVPPGPHEQTDSILEPIEPLVANQHAGDSFSAASSPLSELSNPPGSPPEFLSLPENSHAQHRIESNQSTISNGVGRNSEPEDHVLPPALFTQGARRSLRARQEKQLHPYMYDKAQYQRQCRERGIRPVRLLERATNEIHDGSLDQEDGEVTSSAARVISSSSSLGGLISSGMPLEDSLRSDTEQGLVLQDEDDLPDIDNLLRARAVAGRLHSQKRQKLVHKSNRAIRSEHADLQEDVFSVPPSPPPSSRGSAPRTVRAPQGFRLPRGLSPMPLPTPQISSDARSFQGNKTNTISDEDTPPRTSRRFARVRSAVTIGSDSSTDSGPASEDDQQLLHKERRRIRGVLPASWLNIDRMMHSEPRPLGTGQIERASSGSQAIHQKGVARKVQRRSTATPGVNALELSDGDELSGSDVSTPTAMLRIVPAMTRQSGLVAAQDDVQDVDNMELDWFNPMLAGQARAPRALGSKNKQRARKTNSSKKGSRPDFTEEQNGLRRAYKSNAPRRMGTTSKTKSGSGQRKKAPALGILDTPVQQEDHAPDQPQFVRLAARQARRALDCGRHSPSNKVIRLATCEDTAHANATLEDWRRGAIPARTAVNVRPRIALPKHSSRVVQPNPLTPYMGMTDPSSNSKMPSISPTVGAVAQQDHSSSRPTSRSVGCHRVQARQHVPQPRKAAKVSLDPRDGRTPAPKKIVPPAARYREAQLETQESAYIQQSRSAAFHQRIQCLTETITRRPVTPAAEALPMVRFLQESDSFSRRQHPMFPMQAPEQVRAHLPPNPAFVPHRSRKRRTQRVDVDTRQYRQPSEPLPDVNGNTVHDFDDAPALVETSPVLRGLGPAGTRYATDFDMRHLPTSTYFHESTFVGSGDLASALAVADRNMDRSSGSLRIYIKGIMHEWAAWSEQISSAMAEIPLAVSGALQGVDCSPSPQRDGQASAVTSNVDHMLRSTIRYTSNCLYFLDAIDRRAYCKALDQLLRDIMELTEQRELWTAGFEGLRQQVLQYALVIARQTHIIAHNIVVPATICADLCDLTTRISSRLASHLVPGRLDELRLEYEQQRVLSTREIGIRKQDSVLTGVVILYQCMQTDESTRSSFWDVVRKSLSINAATVHASAEIDAAWYSILSILPCFDFNSAGIIQRRRNDEPASAWRLPGELLERCLALYPATSAMRVSSVNEYIRAILTRCSHLFSTWRWWRCESIICTVYDFFARRGLNLLQHEDGHGSPEFLETLTCFDDMSLQADANDSSFSVFLKFLASSLRTWSQLGVYTDKKIGGIAWRIIPNHARIYRRDAEVQRTDLDALRNHFDLLCTLYFASPPLHRLRVDMLRNLVDHSSSHREACRISVRAWSRLASFQASTDESTDNMAPFIHWFKDMLQTTVAQYRLARTEAEQQYADAKASGAISLDNGILERTIASNQRQIAATIVDLLAAYRRALTSASCSEAARLLIIGCEPWKGIDSFHPSERRLTTVYIEMLDLFKANVDVQQRFRTIAGSHTQSEDSQDYGDVDILQEFATSQPESETAKEQDLVALMHDAFAQLVSDAFGSETSPDDSLLSRLLETWIQCAQYLVSSGLRSWSNFLVDYNAGAWNQLRDTAQRRKFTPYTLAAIIKADPYAFVALRTTFLGTWLEFLVERASTLKYQHLLTEALLNVSLSMSDPVLQNLPFSKTPEAPLYHVTLQELQQRRLALISSVLSNMLEHYNQTMLNQPRILPELGRVYSELVHQVMQAMKSNYQELQQGHHTDIADVDVRGDYVIFVQEVVALLQQYTIEGVYTVDRFFLDSSAFPLPADDPTYVVGRLRKHVPRLADARTRKQLATFLHNISERAAFDQEQTYLTDQLYKAMSGTLESGDVDAPTLRHVLLTSVIPAYIEAAIGDAFTWILATPMIDASAKSIADLLYDTNMSSENSVTAAAEQISSILSAVQKALAQLHVNLNTLKSPRVLKSIGAIFNMCQATIIFANYVRRSTGHAAAVWRQLRHLQRQANTIEEYLTAPDDFFDYTMDDMEENDSPRLWPDTYDFTSKHVRESVANDWSLVDERYFVKRGSGSREVVVQVGGYEEERHRALEAIVEFKGICERQNRCGPAARRGRRGGGGSAFGFETLVI